MMTDYNWFKCKTYSKVKYANANLKEKNKVENKTQKNV